MVHTYTHILYIHIYIYIYTHIHVQTCSRKYILGDLGPAAIPQVNEPMVNNFELAHTSRIIYESGN